MVEPTPRGLLLEVRVIPRAGRSGVAGIRGDALLVRLAAAPVDGAANAELIDVIAGAFGVPRRAVTLVSGARGRLKRLRIAGADAGTVAAVLARAASDR